jgi:hypothetical protein
VLVVGKRGMPRCRDIIDTPLCLKRCQRIQTPNGEIQRSAEANPPKVGDQRQGSGYVDRVEE